MAPTNRNRNIVIAVIALLIVGTFVFLLSNMSKKGTGTTNKPGNATSNYDQNSGENVSTIQGENNSLGQPKDYPIFLGINDLVSHGLSSDQVTNMKNAFYQYSKANSLGVKQVSVSVNTIKGGVLNAGTDDRISTLTFNVVYDNKTTQKATVQYSGLSDTQLLLYDASNGTQIYDSGLLTTSY